MCMIPCSVLSSANMERKDQYGFMLHDVLPIPWATVLHSVQYSQSARALESSKNMAKEHTHNIQVINAVDSR